MSFSQHVMVTLVGQNVTLTSIDAMGAKVDEGMSAIDFQARFSTK
jgi:hypothetical protein